MKLDSILTGEDAAALWGALDGDDPERAAAAWALAQLVGRDAAAARAWRARAAAAVDAGDPAWAVACFLDLTPFLDVVAAALLRPRTRVGAARAMWLHARRGGRLGGAKRALIGAQRADTGDDDASDWAAFALAAAHQGGEDFSDCGEDLIGTFDVRWESARIVDALIDAGHDFAAHAGAVAPMLWLPSDERGRTALRIVAQAVARGVAVELTAVGALLSSQRAVELERGLRITAALAAAGADVAALAPAVHKLAKDKRAGVSRAAAETAKALRSSRSSKGPRGAPSQRGASRMEQAVAAADGAAIARLLRGGAAARAQAGALHGAARDVARAADVAQIGAIAAGTAGAVASDDEVLRFAVIDTLAVVGGAARCDLAAHVPALVAALRIAKKPAFASGSGAWQTRGMAWSARRALTHAVRWGDARLASEVAAALAVRAAEPSSYAGHALAEGLALSQRAGDVAALLAPGAKTSPGARAGLLRGLVAADVVVDGAIAAAVTQARSAADEDIAAPAMLLRVQGASPRAHVPIRAARLRAADARIRRTELDDLSVVVDAGDAAALAGLESVLVAALAGVVGDDVTKNAFLTGHVARLLAKLGDRGGASLVDHVPALVAAWDRTARDDVGRELAACLRIARRQGADVDGVAAKLKDKIMRAGAADLLAPAAAPSALSPAQEKALVASLRLPLRESHPSAFAEACEATAQAAALLRAHVA